ncbi:MAG: TonB-dependent receptor plug domain-containing protein [Treponema sp.]|jgi:hypothetical protein|nr:TonB-dependent receptor plug domain-containing protein [Treponema sp.]
MKIPHPLIGFAFFLFFPAVIFARDISITVEDEDLAMPLEGALITLRNGSQFYSDEDGIARITLPDDRQTIITVSYPGYEPQRMTIPQAGTGGNSFKASLRLGGIMTSQELVIEASRPETSETRSGRSVAISERELTRTAEIGIIEDVMNSVKLLPGVGYSGMFNAMPSIRGGDPGDLMATLDGFYLERPYHWMGSISIFDPKMISSARLSHGVFSARYGHTISGLLEVISKSPSPDETELEAAVGSSAASLNLSVPFGARGGILFMGKVTYWDTFIWAMKGLSRVIEDETLDAVNSITTSPYIRSAALSMNYRLAADMELKLNGFYGSDGIGVEVNTDYSQSSDEGVTGLMSAKADYDNYQGFLIAALTASPVPKLAMRFTGGAGFIKTITNDYINNEITAHYNDRFLSLFPSTVANELRGKTYSAPNVNVSLDIKNEIFNTQGRADFDIDLGHGFITAFGVQELYSIWKNYEDIDMFLEIPISSFNPNDPEDQQRLLAMRLSGLFPIMDIPNAALIRPMGFVGDVNNHGFTTSGYGLIEYASPDQRFGAEFGLRVDHLYFIGKGFKASTAPALNPRINLDFVVLKNHGELDSLTATIGSGLFSSVNNLISFVDEKTGLGDNDLKFNRSWTTVTGLKFDFFKKYSFNIEGYYKYVFDRAYITADLNLSGNVQPVFNFDGAGHVWGFDFQLQKLESRYWDGWISYTFTWAKYMDPNGGGAGLNMNYNVNSEGDKWYFPSFHRYHNANIVLNIKPLNWFNVALRFGFASGQPARKIISYTIYPYPVQVIDENGLPQLNENGKPVIIQKYDRDAVYENTRSAWSLPLDVKLSFFFRNKSGRSGLELYFAVENLLSLVYKPTRNNTRFNEYTGREEQSAGSGNFDLPIPMVSFGLKWKY